EQGLGADGVRESAGAQREVFDVSGSDAPEPGADQPAVVIDVGQRAEACGVEASAQLLGCLRGHGAHGWRAPGGRAGPHTRAGRSAVRGRADAVDGWRWSEAQFGDGVEVDAV